jgi:hypothetical protein
MEMGMENTRSNGLELALVLELLLLVNGISGHVCYRFHLGIPVFNS